MFRSSLLPLTVIFALTACNGDKEGDSGGSPEGIVIPDADGDGISDGVEGEVDSDGDGSLDMNDTDSDGDCIPDSVERGDVPEGGLPADTDNDGVPNYLDTDSDNNGRLDADEAGDCATPSDNDADGAPNFMDMDNDGDGISDLEEGTVDPDGDGIPAWNDTDSDGDCLPDAVEAGDEDLETPARDTDEDGSADYLDSDSDEDGTGDQEEADGACTDPTDTDVDGIIDVIDPDTDGDGLDDVDEVVAGTDPKDSDTDDDGFTDGLEVYASSNPTNRSSGPEGVVLSAGPRERIETSGEYTLEGIPVDVFLLADDAYSYSCYHPEHTTFIPEVAAELFSRLPDSTFGFGVYDDYKSDGDNWQATGGHPYELEVQQTTDESLVSAAAITAAMTYGGDDKGSSYEAIFQAMSGQGFDMDCDGAYDTSYDVKPFIAEPSDAFLGAVPGSNDPSVEGTGTLPGTGWREASVKIIIVGADNDIRDERQGDDVPEETCDEPAGFEHAVSSIADHDGRFLGINVYEYQSSDHTLQEQLEELAEATGSYIDKDGDGTNDDLAVISGSWDWPAATEVVDAVEDLIAEQSLDLNLEVGEDAKGWITEIGPETEFPGVVPGETITFDVILTTSAKLDDDDQFYYATLLIKVGDATLQEVPMWIVIHPETT